MAGCRQVSFSLCQFLETEVIHQSGAEVCAEKPLAPVPAQTILHRLRPVPKRFPVHGDPSAPGTCLRRTLGLGSREALISQSEPENKRVRVNTLRGRQALSSAKELLQNKEGWPLCISSGGIHRPSLPASVRRGTPEVVPKPLRR